MKKLLEFLIKNIVETENFEVEEVEDGDRLVYEVKADKSIIGMIIGKDGSTIKNLRRIMAIKATLENKLIGINVTEI